MKNILTLLFILSWRSVSSSSSSLPNIFFVIVDDFGWGDSGWHRHDPEIVTPTMNELVRNGIELDRHYVHPMCTPSRSSFQSGRLPVHILQKLVGPCDKNGAIPRNITGIAAKLKEANYSTHHVGKWDAGMASPVMTPHGRGYDTALSYFSHGNWGWTQAEWRGSTVNRSTIPTDPVPGIIDLYDTDTPASSLNGTKYEEYIFRDRMLKIIREHDSSRPLFLNYASKIVHYPLQVPIEYQEKFSFIQDDDNRKMYHAMVNFLDDQLKNITDALKEYGYWNNTLMVLTSDNGGYVLDPQGLCNTTTTETFSTTDVGHGTACFNGEAGANNYPLRGGKYSTFEGGIRVNAFVSGGFVPKSQRGKKLDGIVHIADWYGTLCEIAGVNPTDNWAKRSGLPAVDSKNVWPYISGEELESPRDSFLVSKDVIVNGTYKFARPGTKMIESEWGGPHYPNASTASDAIGDHSITCPETGCLFNVVQDVREKHEISSEYPDIVSALQKLLDKEASTIWSQPHGNDPKCRETAWSRYGGFFGPWLELDNDN